MPRKWEYEEDLHIRRMVRLSGTKWDAILECLPSDRTRSAVRNRWMRLRKSGGVNRCKLCGQLLKGHSCPARLATVPVAPSTTPPTTPPATRLTIPLDTHVDFAMDVGTDPIVDVVTDGEEEEMTTDLDDETDDEDELYEHVLQLVDEPLPRRVVDSLNSIFSRQPSNPHNHATRQNAPRAKGAPVKVEMLACK